MQLRGSKRIMGSRNWKRVVVGTAILTATLRAAVYPESAGSEPAGKPVAFAPPQVNIHCRRDERAISIVLRWDYNFVVSPGKVSGFHVYRRVEKGDYSLVTNIPKSGEEKNTTVYQESPDTYVYSYKDSCVCDGGDYTYKVAAFDSENNEASYEVRIRLAENADVVGGPSNVLIVVNKSSRQSVAIGEYYRDRRGVPGENVLYLPYSGNTQMIWEGELQKVEAPIRDYLVSHGLREKILYIVLTYDLPYKVIVQRGKGVVSIDAHLTDLFDDYRNDPNFEIGAPGERYRNPYLLAGSHFSRANGNRGYLVTRLDGPLARPGDSHYNKDTEHADDELQYLKNMVDYALWAEKNPKELSGKGYFDRRFEDPWQTIYGKGDLSINGAYDCSAKAGFESVLDTSPWMFGTAHVNSGGNNPLRCDDALWYAGWYSHFYKDVFEWRKGAVGFHLESWTARDMRTESKFEGQSGWLWVPGMIRTGITATMGPVHEPGLSGVPQIDWFFRYFLHGFNFAESAYMANHIAEGQIVMIGDPLYNPFPNNRLDSSRPKITLTSPTEGQTIHGTKVVVEGTVDDKSITLLDNMHPVREGRFRYTRPIGTSSTNEANLPLVVGATNASGNTTSATVTVHWVNRPPSLSQVQPVEGKEGETFSLDLKGSDPDDDSLSYSFAIGSARPKGATLSPRGQFKWKPDSTQAGTYNFKFQVTDGFATNATVATVTVKQAGSHPPKFKPLQGKFTKEASRTVFFVLEADDPDGDTLKFSAGDSLPEGARILQSPPKRVVFLWRPTPEQVGLHKIAFTVSDEKGGEDTMTVEVEVVPPSEPGKP